MLLNVFIAVRPPGHGRSCVRGNTAKHLLALGVLALLFQTGCHRSNVHRGAVQGRVTCDGRPMECGSILFVPTDGTEGPVTGGPITAGQYRLSRADGPVQGCNRVEIRGVRKSGKKVPSPYGQPGEEVEEWVDAVAEKFNVASILKKQILPGDNTADFETTSP